MSVGSLAARARVLPALALRLGDRQAHHGECVLARGVARLASTSGPQCRVALQPVLLEKGQALGQLVERFNAEVRSGGVGVSCVDVTPRPSSYQHGDYPCGESRADVVVQPVADVRDLTRRAATFGDDPVEELWCGLLDTHPSEVP